MKSKSIWRESEAVDLKNEIGHNDILMVSGFFDPLHGGHIDNILDATGWASTYSRVVVVVNGDNAAKRKKGYVLLPVEHRMKVIAAIRGVDYVIDFDTNDMVEAIKIFRPAWFFKGGDRQLNNLNQKEVEAAKEYNCHITIGKRSAEKTGSSSDFFFKAYNEFTAFNLNNGGR